MENILQTFSSTLVSKYHDKEILFDIKYYKNLHKKPVIIFIHGFKGFKDWGHFNLMADYFAEKGFVYCKLNLSHNGTTHKRPTDFVDLEAFGQNNFSIELNDVGAMIDYFFSEHCEVPEEEINRNQLFLIGHSRGGAIALIKASEDKRVKGIATLAAVSDFKDRWTEEYLENWKEKGVTYVYNGRTHQNMPLYYQLVENLNRNINRLNISQAVQKIKTPGLIIHGTSDETLPITMAKELKKYNPDFKLTIIEDAGHTFGGYHPYKEPQLPEKTLEALTAIENFFTNL